MRFILLAAALAIQINSQSLVWKDAPPSLPKGSKVVVLEGDPRSGGIFTMRLDIPAGAKIPPHFHPRAERVTVLSGDVEVGFGDAFDESKLHAFHAGDFYVNPPNDHHFVYFRERSVIQITSEGPWELKTLE